MAIDIQRMCSFKKYVYLKRYFGRTCIFKTWMDYYNSCEATKFQSVLSRIIKYLMASAYCIYYYFVRNMRLLLVSQ